MRVRDRVHSDQLPKSYYAEHRRDRGCFDRLEGSQTADVLVIGGGFSGVAACLMLADQGVDTILLEQNEIGWGASGRNGGQLIGGFANDLNDVRKVKRVFGEEAVETVLEMGVECVCIVREIIHKYDIACDLKWGYLDAAMSKRELKALTEAADILRERGYPHHVYPVSPDAISQHIGGKRFMGGLVNMGWGHLQPLDLVRGEARAAVSRGAHIYEHARVHSLKVTDKVVAYTDTGSIRADRVLVAGGAYIGNLVPALGRRVCPAGSYVIATEPLGDSLKAVTLPSDMAVCDQRTAFDYFRMSSDGRLLFGGMATYSGLHPRNITKAMRPKMLKVFPHLKEIKIDYAWGGHLGLSMNRIPQVGKIGDRLYYAQAYSGHGLAPSHMAARLVVEALQGKTHRFDLMARVRHRPFPGGALLRHPLLTAGMMLHRLLNAFS